MTKTKSTKRALLLSALSLLMCVSMLIGSTFAWFTDSVTSAGNKIKAGTLDIQLLMYDGNDYTDISDSNKPIFGAGSVAQDVNAETLWEPGKTQVAYLAIKNNGNLALKYKVALDVENISKDLYKVMEYAIVPDAQPDSVKSWSSGNSVVEGKQIVATDISMDPGTTHYFALAIHMMEAAGNEYQDGKVDFDLTVLATQLEAEFDSFNNTYDKDATYPLGKNSQASVTYNAAEHGIDFAAEVEIPADAPEGEYELILSKPEDIVITNDNGVASMAFDMKLTRTVDGSTEEVTNSGIAYPVTVQLPHHFVAMQEVWHNGEKVENFTYDKNTHTISFTTTHFSPFEIKYTDYVDPSFELDYEVNDAQAGQYTITKGMFVGKNPVDFDSSLAAADSKYIAVDFVKDDIKYYVVSERANTVFVAADATTEYSCENGTFSVTCGQSGKLYSVISGLQSKAHSTIYLLPGTYNEGTTINVYSSMDIVGLGDTDKVKVVKTSSSSSNRHLFNCNGTKADYIQVTLRNMTLDATAKTTNNKDNAAVQSIRKTKVKCYDLDIVKGSGLDAVAFYVNGNNAVDGVKYPAYLYAENCTLNTARAFGVISYAGTYKFYHNNLTYGGILYTSNSGSIKNVVMVADDWDW